MTAIYHDLESGAAVAIFSKPVSRFAFTVGKVARRGRGDGRDRRRAQPRSQVWSMLLFGGGLEERSRSRRWPRSPTPSTLMLIVLALSTWMNNIVAAIVAFIYNAVGGIRRRASQPDRLGQPRRQRHPQGHRSTFFYWLVPHQLISDAPRELRRAEIELFATPGQPAAGREPGAGRQCPAASDRRATSSGGRSS